MKFVFVSLVDNELMWRVPVEAALSFTVASVIASKSQESDYDSVAKNVFQQVSDYNKCLIESLQNNKT